MGIFGEISYSRSVLIPADKRSAKKLWETEQIKSIAPVDCVLGIDILPFKVSCKMMCAAAKEAVRARSYSDAKNNIAEKYHINLSAAQIEKITDYIGNLVFDDQVRLAKEAEKSAGIKVDKRRRRRRNNDILYLEIDGAMIHIRDKQGEDGWMESKHAIAFHSADIQYYESAKNGEINHRILKRDFIGYIGTADEFKYHFLSLAKQNQSDVCSEVVIISDGASWIQTIAKELFPNATHILDLYHAKENAGKFANAVKEGEADKKAFADYLCELIDSGEIDTMLQELEAYKDTRLPVGILNFYTYVKNHRNCMNYPEYRKKGYFVGSGAIESGNIRIMQNRMKLQGMRWNLKNAQGMLALKAKYESDNWDDVISIVQNHFYNS